MTRFPAGIREDLATAFRGFFMGMADVIPGVSGGTIALIAGIYERLVTAISHIDLRLAGYVRQRQWRQAAEHADVRFLAGLVLGIGTGFVVMTVLISHLLSDPVSRSLTLAAFFGLILGSAVMLSLMIRADSRRQAATCLLAGIAGAALAYWLTTLGGDPHEPGYAYIFFCACVAICAMILPGISGAMILLILGVYEHLMEIPGNLLHGREVVTGLLTIAVFATGAGISLVLFSRLLRWLLKHYSAPTMALLCGLMVGSLPKLWPFQEDVTPDVTELKFKQFRPVWPDDLGVPEAGAIALAVVAALLVIAVDSYLRRAGRRNLPDAQ